MKRLEVAIEKGCRGSYRKGIDNPYIQYQTSPLSLLLESTHALQECHSNQRHIIYTYNFKQMSSTLQIRITVVVIQLFRQFHVTMSSSSIIFYAAQTYTTVVIDSIFRFHRSIQVISMIVHRHVIGPASIGSLSDIQ
eukprot:g8919.t1